MYNVYFLLDFHRPMILLPIIIKCYTNFCFFASIFFFYYTHIPKFDTDIFVVVVTAGTSCVSNFISELNKNSYNFSHPQLSPINNFNCIYMTSGRIKTAIDYDHIYKTVYTLCIFYLFAFGLAWMVLICSCIYLLDNDDDDGNACTHFIDPKASNFFFFFLLVPLLSKWWWSTCLTYLHIAPSSFNVLESFLIALKSRKQHHFHQWLLSVCNKADAKTTQIPQSKMEKENANSGVF